MLSSRQVPKFIVLIVNGCIGNVLADKATSTDARHSDVRSRQCPWDLLVSTSLPSGDLTHYGSSPLTCYRSLRYISSPRSNDSGGRCPIFTPGRLRRPVGHKVSRLCTCDFRCRLQMRSWL